RTNGIVVMQSTVVGNAQIFRKLQRRARQVMDMMQVHTLYPYRAQDSDQPLEILEGEVGLKRFSGIDPGQRNGVIDLTYRLEQQYLALAARKHGGQVIDMLFNPTAPIVGDEQNLAPCRCDQTA